MLFGLIRFANAFGLCIFPVNFSRITPLGLITFGELNNGNKNAQSAQAFVALKDLEKL